MQVAHHNDFVTHAVIGGAQAIEFGISNSAEFFNILSSTLYKDQILAVVREVLCNAWDAHIEAGITDKPVEITLTDDKFIIRDFGTGIHKDDMGPIYGTYGNSTKKNDGKQTGGFGLGCKAPFAYTDHFEVVSSHDGVRTIYNLSKSSAAALGKPGIVPIASFPTTESGLQVTIHIANSSDVRKFRNLIHRIVRNGDMNMTFNAEPLVRINFDSAKSNYFITDYGDLIDNAPKIMIRYGNVLYPVDCVDGIRVEYQRIVNHLDRMQGRQKTYRIIFQAPPHSISVTPSRESLSMQEHTMKTLKGLFHGFLDMLDSPIGGFRERCEVFAETAVKSAVAKANIAELLNTDARLPGAKSDTAPSQISDLEAMAHRYMTVNYPSDLAFRKQDITWRLKGMVDAKLLDRGLVQTYLRDLDSATAKFQGERTSWLQRQVIAPMLVRMLKDKLDVNKLYAYDSTDRNAPDNYYRKGIAPLVKATSISPASHIQALPYLRNMVVISTSARNIKERAALRDTFRNMGTQNAFLFYHVGLKKNERENALEFFTKAGMVVIDLTEKTAHEVREAEYKVLNAKPRKPVMKGTVSMLSVLVKDSKRLNTALSRAENAKHIAEPEFIVQVSMRSDVSKYTFDHWDDTTSHAIVTLFGDKGGLTFNSAIHDKWIKKGVMEMDDYVITKVIAEVSSNPRIKAQMAFDVDCAIAESNHFYSHNENSLVKFAYSNPMLQKEFGLVNDLNEQDKQYVLLWKKILNARAWTSRKDVHALSVELHKIKLDPANAAFLELFRNNITVNLLNESRYYQIMKDPSGKSEHIAAAAKLLLAALKQ